jgi:hypothetical protein
MIALSSLLTGLPGLFGYRVKALRTAGQPQYSVEAELEPG